MENTVIYFCLYYETSPAVGFSGEYPASTLYNYRDEVVGSVEEGGCVEATLGQYYEWAGLCLNCTNDAAVGVDGALGVFRVTGGRILMETDCRNYYTGNPSYAQQLLLSASQ